jgi:hypothetical protein
MIYAAPNMPVKIKCDVPEMVRRVRSLRGPQPNAPKGLPQTPVNDDDKAPERKYNQEGLSDAGFPSWITGSGRGREMW